MAHLLKYDSNYGVFSKTVSAEDDRLLVDGRAVQVLHGERPEAIDWSAHGVDVVLECTGRFTTAEKASGHLRGTVRRVVISAPAKDEAPMFVLGVNERDYDPAVHRVVSMGTCTTNCLLPVLKVLDGAFGVVEGMMTTVHSYTNDQRTLDGTHKDLRRARAAAVNIIPTSTGAQRAVGQIWPAMGKSFHGSALRVPTPVVSAVDLVVRLRSATDREAVNAAFLQQAAGPLRGILDYTEAPVVSSDLRGSPASATVDGQLTATVGELCKVLAWYDNEWGYAARLVDFVEFLAQREAR